MLKKLRRKIIWINMTLVSVVLLAAVLVLFHTTVQTTTNSLYYSLFQEISKKAPDRDQIPTQLGQKQNPPYHTPTIPHVTAFQRPDGTWDIESAEDVSIDDDSLIQALTRAQRAEKNMGLFTDLRLVYVRQVMPDGMMLVFGDSSLVRLAWHNGLMISVTVFLAGLAIFFLISLWLSRMAVQPIERAWQQQKQFIADASHELKTPLTVILANNNIMSSHQEETVAQQSQWIRSTTDEAQQMHSLIDEMLTLARTDDERAALLLQPVNLSDLVEETILFLEPVAYERGISLDAHIARDLVLETEPTLMRKLTAILVDNAVKHGAPDSLVTVTLTGGRSALLSVHNYGTPIAPEDLPHLFDRFYRSDKSRSTAGHGLGLAIAQSIAQRLRGKLTVSSSEQEGTTFSVELKL